MRFFQKSRTLRTSTISYNSFIEENSEKFVASIDKVNIYIHIYGKRN